MMSLGIADANKLMFELANAPLSLTENTTKEGHSVLTTKGINRLMADLYRVPDDNVTYYGWNYVNKGGADVDHLWVMTQTIKADDDDIGTLRKLVFVGWWNRKSAGYPEGEWGATNKVLVIIPDRLSPVRRLGAVDCRLSFKSHLISFKHLESFLSDSHEKEKSWIVIEGSLPTIPPKLWQEKEYGAANHLGILKELKEIPSYALDELPKTSRAGKQFRTPELKFYTMPIDSIMPKFILLNWKEGPIKALLNL